MKASAKKSAPVASDAKIKSAYAMWKQGGVSIWQVKAKTGIKARVLLPAFEKLSGKKIKSPAMKLPSKKSAKEEVRRAA